MAASHLRPQLIMLAAVPMRSFWRYEKSDAVCITRRLISNLLILNRDYLSSIQLPAVTVRNSGISFSAIQIEIHLRLAADPVSHAIHTNATVSQPV
jgi:hypothetical protein